MESMQLVVVGATGAAEMLAALPMSDQANSHLLTAITHASGMHRIVASCDIFDARGTKLWAKEKPVSVSLQQALLDRRLREPIEACLRAEDGFTNVHLVETLRRVMASNHVLSQAIATHGAELEAQAAALPLHSAVQLLLTVNGATHPRARDHSVHAMALAGAMAQSAGLDRMSVRLAMLAGLLHDLGEMYIDPRYLDASQSLDAVEFRNVVVHPAIGGQLLRRLTDYPAALAQGIAEHHERLDATGYPMRFGAGVLGVTGRLLAVVETTLGIVGNGPAGLQRASFALRFVPGEYDSRWVGFISRAASQAGLQSPLVPSGLNDTDRCLESAALLRRLRNGLTVAVDLANRSKSTPRIHEVACRTVHRLERLDVAARSVGLGEAANDNAPTVAFEQEMALREIRYRLRAIRRECLWSLSPIVPSEHEMLSTLWTQLDESGLSEGSSG
jgi:hypothetical protein